MPAGLLIQGSDPASACSSSSKGQEIPLTVGPSGFLPQAFCPGKGGATTLNNGPAQLRKTSQKTPLNTTELFHPLFTNVFLSPPRINFLSKTETNRIVASDRNSIMLRVPVHLLGQIPSHEPTPKFHAKIFLIITNLY